MIYYVAFVILAASALASPLPHTVPDQTTTAPSTTTVTPTPTTTQAGTTPTTTAAPANATTTAAPANATTTASTAGFALQPLPNSCTRFTLGGSNFTCPFGLIFSPQLQVCVYPDTVNVPNCSAHQIFNITCKSARGGRFFGNYGNYGSYGNYGNYGSPTYLIDYGTYMNNYGGYSYYPSSDYETVIDIYYRQGLNVQKPGCCQYYFICMPNGEPRLLGCPEGQVFNTRTFKCDEPRKVAECA